MPDSLTQRWTLTQPSPLGETSASWELDADVLRFRSEAPLGGGSMSLRLDEVAEAATAVVELPAGKGGPDMVAWMPGRLEWLVVSRRGHARGLMQPLPAGDARDAIVSGLRERLGARWVGERMPLQAARQRFKLSSGGDGLKVAVLVGSVLLTLLVMLFLFSVLSALLLLPAGFVFGGWLFHRGLAGLRDALHIENTPTAKVSSAAIGLVELEGRAVTDRAEPAGVSGVPSVWWDVTVDVWDRSKDKGGWKQVMARHGGSAETLLLEDGTGRVPLWLRDADLVLEEHAWETGKHHLPPRGMAMLNGTAFDWRSGARLRVRERRMAAGGPIYVLGTLDEARHAGTAQPSGFARVVHSLRTGSWRAALIGALPAVVRAPVYIAFSYIDMLTSVGHGGARRQRLQDIAPPAVEPTSLLVWKGRAGRAFIVSDQRETQAVKHLRKRSLWTVGIGVAVLCWCLYELITAF
jgi:hypothetical protein